MLDFTRNVTRFWHGVEYKLVLCCEENENLKVVVEQMDSHKRWNASFSAPFIEEITRRTGNYKSFPVFVKMILTALAEDGNLNGDGGKLSGVNQDPDTSASSNTSASVFLDLLTSRDLDLLRQRSIGGPGGGTTNNNTINSNTGPKNQNSAQTISNNGPSNGPVTDKRYLILTYNSEFDKVHYPLALVPDESMDDPEVMRTLIAQLKSQLNQMRKEGGVSSQQTLQQPGLSQQAFQPQSLQQQSSYSVDSTTGNQSVHSRSIYEPHREARIAQQEREIMELRSDLKNATQENARLREVVADTKSGPTQGAARPKSNRAHDNLREVQQRKEIESLKKELTFTKNQLKRLQATVKRLEGTNDDLKRQLLNRGGVGGTMIGGGRGTNSSRPASIAPGSRANSRPVSRPPSRAPSVGRGTGPSMGYNNGSFLSNRTNGSYQVSRASSIASSSRVNSRQNSRAPSRDASPVGSRRGTRNEYGVNPLPARPQSTRYTYDANPRLPPSSRRENSRDNSYSGGGVHGNIGGNAPPKPNYGSNYGSNYGDNPHVTRVSNSPMNNKPISNRYASPKRVNTSPGQNFRSPARGASPARDGGYGGGYGRQNTPSPRSYGRNRGGATLNTNAINDLVVQSGNHSHSQTVSYYAQPTSQPSPVDMVAGLREFSVSPSSYKRGNTQPTIPSLPQHAMRPDTLQHQSMQEPSTSVHPSVSSPYGAHLKKPPSNRTSPRVAESDVDARLNALQHFLRNNKSGV